MMMMTPGPIDSMTLISASSIGIFNFCKRERIDRASRAKGARAVWFLATREMIGGRLCAGPVMMVSIMKKDGRESACVRADLLEQEDPHAIAGEPGSAWRIKDSLLLDGQGGNAIFALDDEDYSGELSVFGAEDDFRDAVGNLCRLRLDRWMEHAVIAEYDGRADKLRSLPRVGCLWRSDLWPSILAALVEICPNAAASLEECAPRARALASLGF